MRPIGVPGPVCVRRSFCSCLSIQMVSVVVYRSLFFTEAEVTMIRRSTHFAAILVGLGLVWAAFAFQSPQAQAPAGGVTALTGARVIDGTGAEPLEGATIVVSDGRIQAVGRNVTIPAG